MQVRKIILQAVKKAGAGHVGGPLSMVEIALAMYFKLLRIDPKNPQWPDRDRYILSKGHSCIALYAVLALRGYFPLEEVFTFDAIDSRMQGHPDMTKTPGIDMASGSLGTGASPALGMALAARRLGKDFHTWVHLGDGEIQEGQVWEMAFIASHYKVDNLTAIVDYNKVQQFGFPQGRESPAPGQSPGPGPGEMAGLRLERHRVRRPRLRLADPGLRRGQGHQGPADLHRRPHDQGQGRLLHGGRLHLARQGADRGGAGEGAGRAGCTPWPGSISDDRRIAVIRRRT